MENGALVLTQEGKKTLTDMKARINLLQIVMRNVMKKETHYGTIPGCGKPSLWKPGAEIIMAAFNLSVEPIAEDLSKDDEIRYRVKVTIKAPNGQIVGSGIGECSSNEEKYKWRKAVCEEEFAETPEDRRRQKWVKPYQKQAFKIAQIRTNPADLANTILKMAKKRALIDGVLTATAASDIFTQDLEDLPPEYINSEKPEPQTSKSQPQKPAPQPATDPEEQVRIKITNMLKTIFPKANTEDLKNQMDTIIGVRSTKDLSGAKLKEAYKVIVGLYSKRNK